MEQRVAQVRAIRTRGRVHIPRGASRGHEWFRHQNQPLTDAATWTCLHLNILGRVCGIFQPGMFVVNFKQIFIYVKICSFAICGLHGLCLILGYLGCLWVSLLYHVARLSAMGGSSMLIWRTWAILRSCELFLQFFHVVTALCWGTVRVMLWPTYAFFPHSLHILL